MPEEAPTTMQVPERADIRAEEERPLSAGMQPKPWPRCFAALPWRPRAPIIAAMRRRFAILALGAAPLLGQEARGDQEPKRLFVDAVVATINDTTILQSRLFETAKSRIRVAEEQNQRTLPLEIVSRLIAQDLLELISHYQMAQSAKSFSTLPPEQIDKVLDIELDRDKQDRVRDLGSALALSEELQERGQTWPSYAREQRIEKLHDFAMQFAVFERLRKQSNLYLTPRMLRETYQANRHRFVHDVYAELETISFTGPDAEQKARSASELWRTGDFSPRDIADRNPGGTPLPRMAASSLRPSLKALKSFAEAGPAFAVSDPLPRGDGTFDVARIIAYVPAADGRFEDPKVQEEVRILAREIVISELHQQALEQARQRTEVWVYQNGRRVPAPPPLRR
ncbi:MAG: hypothetical protein H6835_05000 [Planctomycetes bacterium]|nr:hypothetical protein [Planctomycetota bacterium]